MKFMKVGRLMSIALLAVSFVLPACRQPTAIPTAKHSDQKAILLTALANMVTNAESGYKLIRFVKLSTEDIADLNKHCGTQYIILPVNQAEQRQASLGSDETMNNQDTGYYLKNSNKEGVILFIGDIHVDGQHAEVQAEFRGRLNGAGFLYELKRSSTGWQITSIKNIGAV